MKCYLNASASRTGVLQNPSNPTQLAIWPYLIVTVAAGLLLAASPAQASNLLADPGFESDPGGQHVAAGWTYFAPPTLPPTTKDYWVVNQSSSGGSFPPHSGIQFWKEWGALYSGTVSNVAGLSQTFNSSPGSIYQANGWMATAQGDLLGADCYTWLQVEFLDSSSNLLALYKSAPFNRNVASSTNWYPYSVTNACDLTQPIATGDPYFNTYAVTGSVSQLVAPAGTAAIRYRYCYFQAGTEGGSAYFDDAVLDQVSGPVPPSITGLYPQNMILVPPSNGITFTVTSPSGFTISNSAIHLVLNGTDVSGALAISGSASSKNVAYSGLQSNTAYNVTINVSDSSNQTVSASTYFETTWYQARPATYLWEAEDWDFTNGLYIDNPDICNAPGDPNCYFGKVGVQNVDEFNTSGLSGSYRSGDPMGQAPSQDYSRPNLFAANRVDYAINPFIGNPSYTGAEWVNYTRDWPASTNWIIARLATGQGFSGSLQLSVINGGVTNVVGAFSVLSGQGWSTFQYVYLQNTNNQNAAVVLNGKETLQVTSGGNLLPTFFMLVPAELDLPYLTSLYPDGKHPFEPTNTLSFTVTTGSGAIFTANSIQVILDGNNVTPNLVISGSNLSNNVVYAGLEPNAIHTAVINVTNSLGHGISITNQFDTFSQTNYMVEAEDFDYNGGQYVPSASYTPDCYASFVSVSNVDFQHTIVSGEPTNGSDFQYRQNGIPQQPETGDYYRTIFANSFSPDYQLYWFGGGDWANYTRDYPLGKFNVYARSSGLGAFTMNLGQVVSGVGTTNQVVKPIGQFSSTLPGINTFAWMPLTDAGGLAPATVNITGATTLQVSTPTGNCYPNYFMLVPASTLTASAARSGNNINISFPTQNGWSYRVFYRTNLTTGSWTLLNSAVGNGSVVSVTDVNPGDNQRFYKVTSP